VTKAEKKTNNPKALVQHKQHKVGIIRVKKTFTVSFLVTTGKLLRAEEQDTFFSSNDLLLS